MGVCCTNPTTLRLISNNGFHISEHGLAILLDIWNKLCYTRHIKYNWMDHLTGICFKNSHSSAFAGMSWQASSESRGPPASGPLVCLWQSHARFLPWVEHLIIVALRLCSCISLYLFGEGPCDRHLQRSRACDHFSQESVVRGLCFEFLIGGPQVCLFFFFFCSCVPGRPALLNCLKLG